ncbi:MAG: aminoglycoside phosphotransferase family protein [Caldilinea sp.]
MEIRDWRLEIRDWRLVDGMPSLFQNLPIIQSPNLQSPISNLNSMSDLTDSIHTYLTTAPASGFAGLAVDMLDHWHGDGNLLWRVSVHGEDAVVKLFLDAGQARGRRQFDGQGLFAPLGVAPEPLWFDRYPEGLARQVLVYRWVKGRAVNTEDAGELAAVAASAALLHNIDAASVRRISPRAVNLDYFWRILAGGITPAQQWLEENGCEPVAALLHNLAKAAEAIVGAALPLWQTAPPTPTHGDLKLENALIAGGHAVLLDWEMFGLGDPALEVATFLFDSTSTTSEAIRKHWLPRYLDAAQLPGVEARIAIYARLLPFQRLMFLLNGLRQLTPADRRDPAFRSNTDFLIQTITVAGQSATMSLDIGPALTDEALRHAIGRLIFDEGETP